MTEQEWRDDFADQLRRLTYRAGYRTQKDFAEAAGLSEKTISHYRNAERTPDVITLINLCTVLHCDIKELVVTDRYIDRLLD